MSPPPKDGKCRKFDTPFITDSEYKKDTMATVTLMIDTLWKSKHNYNIKFSHTLG